MRFFKYPHWKLATYEASAPETEAEATAGITWTYTSYNNLLGFLCVWGCNSHLSNPELNNYVCVRLQEIFGE